MAWNKSDFKKPTDLELRQQLSEIQYNVTQHEATERPYQNEFDQHWEDGIYVDIVSGEPLFSSRDKYDAGCGWPSFTGPMQKSQLREKTDNKLFAPRTEVRSVIADSHLGHVFNDGPTVPIASGAPATGLRYCINSASLRFVPKAQMEQEGYGAYLHIFSY